MERRYSLERDFGIKKHLFHLKMQNDLLTMEDWWEQAAALLHREGDAYTLDELEVLAKIVFSELDAVVLRNPDNYLYKLVNGAQSNRDAQIALLERIQHLRISPDEPVPSGVTEERINTGRARVLREGKLVGYIWRTRVAVTDSEDYEPGWTHNLTKQLFVGKYSKKTALADLLRMAEAGSDDRRKEPLWAIRVADGEPRPSRSGSSWRIGVYRNESGGLSTAYVSKAGIPFASEKRAIGKTILFHQFYKGMTYKEARQRLLADAEAAGIEREVS